MNIGWAISRLSRVRVGFIPYTATMSVCKESLLDESMLNHLKPPRLKDLGSRHGKMASKPLEWIELHKSMFTIYIQGLPLVGSVGRSDSLKTVDINHGTR